MAQRILVPLDATTFSEQALRFAVSIATKSGAAMSLVTVEVPPPVLFPGPKLSPPLRDVELEYLEGVAARVREVGVADVSVALLTGNAPEALEAHRREIGSNLAVMSTRGRGPVARAWLGSVADHYVRTTSAPVLMVRPEEGVEEVDLDALPTLGRVMVTLDGSALSESVLEPAVSLGRLFDARTTLVRLIEYSNRPESVYLPDAIEAIGERLEEGRKAAEDELERIAMELRADGGVVDRVSRVVAHVAEGILECAAEQQADVIAMASHGRGGLGRLLLGSVADKVLRAADRPILIVRSETN